ncbi:2-dehydro-3-deoxyphosphooctonate aldolase [Flavobacterium crassostreae]|uniref:2-dehydro-3-deoxyphosphooctonate aldolase n=1 Tax=Flavobacterium crassostreae TaxID=1763534 RepID=A0A1B9EA56_9FLAO|nr:2-dehydro-3-deoxyphosphooctonate aldolase [Flavobacterium crassostreae]OCB78791.1 2-dehydro-3-deoxyphosphooctonate aldolase [Flavobacterium crassostreae]
MKNRWFYSCLLVVLGLASCGGSKSTLKNVVDDAPIPSLSAANTFVITQYSTDKKYGYDKAYPINIFYYSTQNDTINQQRFLNALTGPKGEKIVFKKLESCCPFPTKRSDLGVGLLDVYQIEWQGLKTPVVLYMNIYEKGILAVPVGFGLKKEASAAAH